MPFLHPLDKHFFIVTIEHTDGDGRVWKPGYYHANECDNLEGPFLTLSAAKLAMQEYFKTLER
jgi:hypothetical protein